MSHIKQIFYPFSRSYYITFVNASDEEFPIEPPNYLLLNFAGFEQPPTDIQMSKAPYQDGKTLVDQIFDERVITLEFAIFGDTQQEIFDRRITVNQRFNPKLGMGTLRFEQIDGGNYYVDVITKSVNFVESTSSSHNIAVVQLIAPNPFWYDPTQIERIMVGFSGGFSFPFSLGTIVWTGADAWVEVAPKLGAETRIYSLAVYNNKLYGGTYSNGKLYEWNDNDAWVEVAPKPGAETHIFSLAVYNNKLYGGTYPNGKLYEWNDNDAWVEVAPQLGAETRI